MKRSNSQWKLVAVVAATIAFLGSVSPSAAALLDVGIDVIVRDNSGVEYPVHAQAGVNIPELLNPTLPSPQVFWDFDTIAVTGSPYPVHTFLSFHGVILHLQSFPNCCGQPPTQNVHFEFGGYSTPTGTLNQGGMQVYPRSRFYVGQSIINATNAQMDYFGNLLLTGQYAQFITDVAANANSISVQAFYQAAEFGSTDFYTGRVVHVEATQVPEPGTSTLGIVGAIAMGYSARRFGRKRG